LRKAASPLFRTGRSALIIVGSFVGSFALAALATGLLRGSGEESADSTHAAGVELEASQPLPSVAPWNLTVAISGLGRAGSITVLQRPAAAGTGSVTDVPLPPAQEVRPAEDAASGRLLARWEEAAGDRTRRTQAVVEFLDRPGAELARTSAVSPSVARAAESARFVAAVQGNCLKNKRVEPKAVSAAMNRSGAGFGLGRHPRNARYVGARGQQDVRQIGVLGNGKRRLAVAVVAQGPGGAARSGPAERQMLTRVAKWIDDHVHLKKGYMANCSGRD